MKLSLAPNCKAQLLLFQSPVLPQVNEPHLPQLDPKVVSYALPAKTCSLKLHKGNSNCKRLVELWMLENCLNFCCQVAGWSSSGFLWLEIRMIGGGGQQQQECQFMQRSQSKSHTKPRIQSQELFACLHWAENAVCEISAVGVRAKFVNEKLLGTKIGGGGEVSVSSMKAGQTDRWFFFASWTQAKPDDAAKLGRRGRATSTGWWPHAYAPYILNQSSGIQTYFKLNLYFEARLYFPC